MCSVCLLHAGGCSRSLGLAQPRGHGTEPRWALGTSSSLCSLTSLCSPSHPTDTYQSPAASSASCADTATPKCCGVTPGAPSRDLDLLSAVWAPSHSSPVWHRCHGSLTGHRHQGNICPSSARCLLLSLDLPGREKSSFCAQMLPASLVS